MDQMNPLAIELNKEIKEASPSAYCCLSVIGKQMFFPRGILTQSAEANQHANRYNATIGIATENYQPMHLDVTKKFFAGLEPEEIFTYAPPDGLPKLRQLWREKLLRANPSLVGKEFSTPLVVSALTHGLCITADLFVDRGDTIIIPDKMWGVYGLNFVTRKGGRIASFPMFSQDRKLNLDAFEKLLTEEAAKNEKVLMVLSFPNNPTGYTPMEEEADELVSIIKKQAERGTKIVTISDDAYFGLFFEDSIKESLFSRLCNIHENVIAVKLDGATKESYAWGFRTGFVTFGNKSSQSEKLYSALETKLKGLIRATISSGNHPAQSIIEKALQDPDYEDNLKEKFQIMKGRANRLKHLVSLDKYQDAWDYYPFNSGYFMCLRLKRVESERLRLHLLEKYSIGTIALDEYDLRIAFSCVEENDLEDLVEAIFLAENELA